METCSLAFTTSAACKSSSSVDQHICYSRCVTCVVISAHSQRSRVTYLYGQPVPSGSRKEPRFKSQALNKNLGQFPQTLEHGTIPSQPSI
eukprot:10479903-Heterocapsa_arctica.AAC.1